MNVVQVVKGVTDFIFRIHYQTINPETCQTGIE